MIAMENMAQVVKENLAETEGFEKFRGVGGGGGSFRTQSWLVYDE
jgi:hypothetical protein